MIEETVSRPGWSWSCACGAAGWSPDRDMAAEAERDHAAGHSDDDEHAPECACENCRERRWTHVQEGKVML